MKNNLLKIPAIILVIGLVAAVVACLLTGIINEPTVTEQDFNYSATYKLDGEMKTIEGVYRIQFKFVDNLDPRERYYEGQHLNVSAETNPGTYTIAKKDDLELRIVFIFADGYLMGDGDRDDEYSDVIPEPYLAVFDKEGYEYPDPGMVEQFNAELISWETPQPIENSFVFKGFSKLYHGSMLGMLLVGLLVIVACVIFVKRDDTVPDKALDKISVVFNWVIGLAAIPFVTLVAALMELYVSGDELSYQTTLCIPAITAFTIAASVSLRRKGFTKSGFCIQFVGPVLFVLMVIVETVMPA